LSRKQQQQEDIMDNARADLVNAKAQLYLELQKTPKSKYEEADVDIRQMLLKDPELQKHINREQ
jgi:hypothetical protein